MPAFPDGFDVEAGQLAFARGSAPDSHAMIRATPKDFVVNERLDIEHTGEGEHLWIELRKTNWTTPQIASHLAKHFELQVRDIGYSGLKDRRAVTRQWFSMPTPRGGADTNDDLPVIPGIEWLQQHRHSRKLRRGTHQANAFVLNLTDFRGNREQLELDLVRIREQGVPNYFGEQRFANGRNIEAAQRLFKGARLKRTARSMALSATRSLLFNAVLSHRVNDGTWNKLLPGEAVMLNGSHSVFPMPDSEDEREGLEVRVQSQDVHPSGPLPGIGNPVCHADVAELEENLCAQYPELLDGLKRFGVKQARRALRVRPQELQWSWAQPDLLTLSFSLPTGVFATTLLRECLRAVEPERT